MEMNKQVRQKSDLTLGEMLPADDLTIKLDIEGVVTDFELRDINLMDFKWVQALSGGGMSIEDSMTDVGMVSKFLFRLIRDKSSLQPKVFKEYDDDGNPVELTLTGPDQVLRGMTVKLMKANMEVLHQLFADAMPMIEQTNKPVVSEFKKKP